LYAPTPYVNIHRSTLERGLALTRSSRKEKTKEGEKMRRVTMMLAAMAVMVTLFAAVAYAATIEGTDASETLNETNLNDKIYGYDGNDTLDADIYGKSDVLPQGDKDLLYGGSNSDSLDASDEDGRDEVYGGKGYDKCFIDIGDEHHSCEELNGQVQ
jgi:Ca2+-binding RTX toxin-like protein